MCCKSASQRVATERSTICNGTGAKQTTKTTTPNAATHMRVGSRGTCSSYVDGCRGPKMPSIAIISTVHSIQELEKNDFERSPFIAVLRRTNGVVEGPSGAAKLLNLKPSTTRFRMKKLGIRKEHYLGNG